MKNNIYILILIILFQNSRKGERTNKPFKCISSIVMIYLLVRKLYLHIHFFYINFMEEWFFFIPVKYACCTRLNLISWDYSVRYLTNYVAPLAITGRIKIVLQNELASKYLFEQTCCLKFCSKTKNILPHKYIYYIWPIVTVKKISLCHFYLKIHFINNTMC